MWYITGMKVKTRRTNSFPGDNWIGIDVHMNDGRVITPFGVWKRRDRSGTWYESDSGGAFCTLKEAKNKAREMIA